MNQFSTFISRAWKVFFLVNFLVSLVLLYPLFYFFCARGSNFETGFKIMRWWGKYLVAIPGVRYKVIHEGQLPKKPYIICPNHTSYLDIILAYCVFPDYFVFMGKKELGKVPFFKVFFKKMNILVDRKSVSGSHRSLRAAAAAIDNGHCVAIFPEGTISKKAPEMLKFKNGAFKLAAEKGVPIVPVTFVNNWDIVADGPFFHVKAWPGVAKVVVHEPFMVPSAEETDVEAAKQKVYTLIEGKISEYLQSKNSKPLTA
jgi:1-acyl-sn-glycerol-3-phosphate acyltransferase